MKLYREFAPSTFDEKGLCLPERQDWFVHPCGTNRDADALTRSNWRVAERALTLTDPAGEDYETHRFGHWACGWFEIVIVRPGSDCAALAAAHEKRLAEYPILDELDYSALEAEETDEGEQ